MWVIAIIGSASALIESTLAQIYKKKGEDGSCYGGPAYYIEAALHCRPLAIVFCVAMILTYAFGFNMLASYNLQSTFSVFSFYEAKMSPRRIPCIMAEPENAPKIALKSNASSKMRTNIAGNGDCVYRNFTSGSNYQYSERAGNVRAHF